MLRFQIGQVTITRVVEQVTASIGRYVLPQATPELVRAIPWMSSEFLDETGRLLLSIHSLLVSSSGQRILVDTCVGNDKERRFRAWNRMDRPFLSDLAQAGAARDAIDTVLCTHLHIDHVGWNTMLTEGRWVPTFPHARYLFGRVEWEYWKHQPEDQGPILADSVRPILDAGLADLVETSHRVTDEVWLEPTPGHTPGHVSVRIRSRGEEAVITGDLLHHPCQLAHPDWSASVDVDPEESRRTRWRFLEGASDRPVLVIGSHFAGPTAGRIIRDGAVFRLET